MAKELSNGPIFPPCTEEDLDIWLDENALIEAIENGDEEI